MIAAWCAGGITLIAATTYAGYAVGWNRGYDDAEAIWRRCAEGLLGQVHALRGVLHEDVATETTTAEPPLPKVGVGAMVVPP